MSQCNDNQALPNSPDIITVSFDRYHRPYHMHEDDHFQLYYSTVFSQSPHQQPWLPYYLDGLVYPFYMNHEMEPVYYGSDIWQEDDLLEIADGELLNVFEHVRVLCINIQKVLNETNVEGVVLVGEFEQLEDEQDADRNVSYQNAVDSDSSSEVVYEKKESPSLPTEDRERDGDESEIENEAETKSYTATETNFNQPSSSAPQPRASHSSSSPSLQLPRFIIHPFWQPTPTERALFLTTCFVSFFFAFSIFIVYFYMKRQFLLLLTCVMIMLIQLLLILGIFIMHREDETWSAAGSLTTPLLGWIYSHHRQSPNLLATNMIVPPAYLSNETLYQAACQTAKLRFHLRHYISVQDLEQRRLLLLADDNESVCQSDFIRSRVTEKWRAQQLFNETSDPSSNESHARPNLFPKRYFCMAQAILLQYLYLVVHALVFCMMAESWMATGLYRRANKVSSQERELEANSSGGAVSAVGGGGGAVAPPSLMQRFNPFGAQTPPSQYATAVTPAMTGASIASLSPVAQPEPASHRRRRSSVISFLRQSTFLSPIQTAFSTQPSQQQQQRYPNQPSLYDSFPPRRLRWRKATRISFTMLLLSFGLPLFPTLLAVILLFLDFLQIAHTGYMCHVSRPVLFIPFISTGLYLIYGSVGVYFSLGLLSSTLKVRRQMNWMQQRNTAGQTVQQPRTVAISSSDVFRLVLNVIVYVCMMMGSIIPVLVDLVIARSEKRVAQMARQSVVIGVSLTDKGLVLTTNPIETNVPTPAESEIQFMPHEEDSWTDEESKYESSFSVEDDDTVEEVYYDWMNQIRMRKYYFGYELFTLPHLNGSFYSFLHDIRYSMQLSQDEVYFQDPRLIRSSYFRHYNESTPHQFKELGQSLSFTVSHYAEFNVLKNVLQFTDTPEKVTEVFRDLTATIQAPPALCDRNVLDIGVNETLQKWEGVINDAVPLFVIERAYWPRIMTNDDWANFRETYNNLITERFYLMTGYRLRVENEDYVLVPINEDEMNLAGYEDVQVNEEEMHEHHYLNNEQEEQEDYLSEHQEDDLKESEERNVPVGEDYSQNENEMADHLSETLSLSSFSKLNMAPLPSPRVTPTFPTFQKAETLSSSSFSKLNVAPSPATHVTPPFPTFQKAVPLLAFDLEMSPQSVLLTRHNLLTIGSYVPAVLGIALFLMYGFALTIRQFYGALMRKCWKRWIKRFGKVYPEGKENVDTMSSLNPVTVLPATNTTPVRGALPIGTPPLARRHSVSVIRQRENNREWMARQVAMRRSVGLNDDQTSFPSPVQLQPSPFQQPSHQPSPFVQQHVIFSVEEEGSLSESSQQENHHDRHETETKDEENVIERVDPAQLILNAALTWKPFRK